MGGGEQRRAGRWQAKQHSSAFLFHLFTFSVSSNSPPPVPYTQWAHGDWWCRFSFFFFFHISLSQIKLRKHQLPVYLQIYKIQADVLISCAGENSRLSAHWINAVVSTLSDCPFCFVTLWARDHTLWPLTLAGKKQVRDRRRQNLTLQTLREECAVVVIL